MTKLPLSDWPVRASLDDEDLILTSRLGLEINTGPLAGYPGKEITTAEINQETEKFTWADPVGTVTDHGTVRMDLDNYIKAPKVSSYGLFLSSDGAGLDQDGIDYRLQVHTDPEDNLGYVLHPESPWTITPSSPTHESVSDSLGNSLTVGSIYVNGNYYRAVNLIGDNTGGALFASGTSDRYITYDLAEPTMIEKVLISNYRTDHRVNEVRLEYHDGNSWVSLGTYPISSTINAEEWITLPQPVLAKGFRLYATQVTGHGGVGRFVLKFRRNVIMSSTQYQELAFDTTAFTVEETEDAVTVSLRTDGDQFQINTFGRNDMNRVFISNTLPLYSPGGNKFFTVPMSNVVSGFGGSNATLPDVVVDGTTALLPAGQYTMNFTFYADKLGVYRLNVVDAETGIALGYTDVLYNGIFQRHVGLQYMEVDFYIAHARKVSVQLSTEEKGIVVPEGMSNHVSFFRTSEFPRQQVVIQSTGRLFTPCRVVGSRSHEAIIEWFTGSTTDLTDDEIILQVDSDFKIKRAGSTSTTGAHGSLTLHDAFTGEDHSDKLMAPTEDNAQVFELIVKPMRAGTYRIAGTGENRKDNAWQVLPLEEGDVIE